jgi:hypothetical protein
VLDEGAQRRPDRRVHVQMRLILDILVVHFVRIHALATPPGSELSKDEIHPLENKTNT